jgi:hypothetical protein
MAPRFASQDNPIQDFDDEAIVDLVPDEELEEEILGDEPAPAVRARRGGATVLDDDDDDEDFVIGRTDNVESELERVQIEIAETKRDNIASKRQTLHMQYDATRGRVAQLAEAIKDFEQLRDAAQAPQYRTVMVNGVQQQQQLPIDFKAVHTAQDRITSLSADKARLEGQMPQMEAEDRKLVDAYTKIVMPVPGARAISKWLSDHPEFDENRYPKRNAALNRLSDQIQAEGHALGSPKFIAEINKRGARLWPTLIKPEAGAARTAGSRNNGGVAVRAHTRRPTQALARGGQEGSSDAPRESNRPRITQGLVEKAEQKGVFKRDAQKIVDARNGTITLEEAMKISRPLTLKRLAGYQKESAENNKLDPREREQRRR